MIQQRIRVLWTTNEHKSSVAMSDAMGLKKIYVERAFSKSLINKWKTNVFIIRLLHTLAIVKCFVLYFVIQYIRSCVFVDWNRRDGVVRAHNHLVYSLSFPGSSAYFCISWNQLINFNRIVLQHCFNFETRVNHFQRSLTFDVSNACTNFIWMFFNDFRLSHCTCALDTGKFISSK